MKSESIRISPAKLHLLFVFTLLIVLPWSLALDKRLTWVAAGIALFLFGMYFLEQGFKHAATPKLRDFMVKSTDHLLKSIFLGFILTLVCQSSSLVIFLTISLLGTGMIPLSAGLGMILGTNLGATGGAWLISGLGVRVDVAAYALPVLLPGILLISVRSWRRQDLGFILSGLGFSFLGIDYLKDGFSTLQSDLLLAHLPQTGWQEVLAFAGLGLIVTVIVQSSHAALLISIAALASGQISYEGALAFTIGSNVGTTFTSILASCNGGLDAKRLALSHISFNLFTAILFILGFTWTVQINQQIASWIGIHAQDLPLQLALYHSMFNLVGLVLLGSFLRYFQRFIEWCFPTPQAVDERVQALYLTESNRQDPQQACLALTHEVEHLYQQMLEIMSRGLMGISQQQILKIPCLETLIRNPYRMTESVQQMYRKRVKLLYGQILTYAANCKSQMTPEQSECVDKLTSMSRMMIEVIRMLRHLQGNFNTAVEQGNQTQINFHNQLQIRLIQMQKDLKSLLQLTVPCDINDLLDRENKRIHQETRQDREQLDALIRCMQLDPMSAGSLMNDCQMVRTIERALLKMLSEWFEKDTHFNLIESEQALAQSAHQQFVPVQNSKREIETA